MMHIYTVYIILNKEQKVLKNQKHENMNIKLSRKIFKI